MEHREEPLAEIERLRTRLQEAEDLVRALRAGDVETSVDQLAASEAAWLRVSEIRYRRLFEAAHDGILIVDPDTRKIIDANPFMSKLLRYSLAELVGMEVFEIGLFSDAKANKEMFETLKASGQIRYENLPLQSEDGALREVEVVANRYAENGHSVIQFNIRDITERRRVEKELHERQNFLNRIFEVLPGVLYIFDLDESRIVFVNNTAALTYSTEEITAMGADMVPDLMHPDDQQGFLEHVARIRKLGPGATATFEYRMKDTTGAWRWYMSTDTVFLRDASGAVRQFIGSAPEITGLKHAEMALRDSEVRSRRDADELAAIYATAPVGLCVFDRQLRYQRINTQLAEMNGLSVEAHIGKTIREILPEMANELERMAGRVFATGEVVANEMSGMTKAQPGILRHWTAQWVPIKDAGGVVTGINVVAEEITQRKNAEAALEESELRYRTIIDATSALTWSCAPSGLIVEPQPQWTAFTGQSADEMLEGGHVAAFHPDDTEDAWARWTDAVARNVPYRNDVRIRRHDGEWRWMRVLFVPIHRDGQVDKWFGMCVDISERKEAEAALRDSEAQLKFSLKAASAGSWDWHIPSGKIFWSPENYILYDVEPTPAGPVYADWDARVHPDDREQMNLNVRDVMEGRAAEFRTEFRIVARDGTIRWLAGMGNMERAKDGSPVRLSGINIDITLQKQAEEALRESEAQQAFLLELSDALRPLSSPIEVQAVASRLLGERLGASRAYYAENEGGGDAPDVAIVHRDYTKGVASVAGRHKWSDFMTEHRLQLVAGNTLRINNTQDDPTLTIGQRAACLAISMWALLCVPLVKNGTHVATFAVVHSKPWDWSDAEVALVEEVAERTWAAVERAHAEEQLQVAHDTFRGLIDRSPFGTYIVDSDFRMIQMSEGGQKAFGILRPLIGQDFSAVVHAVWPDPFAGDVIARFRHTLATGEPYQAETNERRADVEATEAYDWKIERIMLPDGRPGVVCHFYDLSEKQRQQERIKLLMGEINHRSKNMLSLVDAIARQTARTQPDQFLAVFGQRLRALSASQDLLVKGEWVAVDLGELIRSQLAHFGDEHDGRITIDGPVLKIAASVSQSLGMALHELATNAAKFGSLSNQSGRVAISWGLQPDAGGQAQFAMSWIESGGPRIVKPARRGFGSAMIEGMLKTSLGCEAEIDFAPGGLTWHIACQAAGVIDGDLALVPQSNVAELYQERALGSGRRILVVEDDPMIAMVMGMTLSDAGYVVIGPAGSVANALALLAQHGCDAALLDVNLGRETSEAVARELMTLGKPFVSLSGYSREQLPKAMQNSPLLNKPASSELIIAEIERCLVR